MHSYGNEQDRFIRSVTCTLALLAALIYSCVEADGDVSRWRVAVEFAIEAVIVIVAARCVLARANRMDDLPIVSPILLGVVVCSLLWEPIGRVAFGHGRPMELLLMCSLKNLVLAMAVFSIVPAYRRLSMLGSLFLVVFSAAMSTSGTVHVLVGIFGAGGVCWLATAYWENLRHRLIATQQKSHLPRGWLLGSIATVVVLVATLGIAENKGLHTLQGFFPGSGGSGAYDPFSRSGVGDGDALVAGTDNIQSFAPIENAPFLSSDGPSLYDVYNDLYEEPFIPKSTNRTIALSAQMGAEVEKRIATSQSAGREFSTHRKKDRTGRRSVGDRTSDALCYLAGRTPLHLRLETFDVFDGVSWTPESVPSDPPRLQLAERDGRNWLQISESRRAFEAFADAERHIFTNVSLDTNRIPAPLHTSSLHVEHLQDIQLFEWAQSDILMMRRDKLAPLVPIHIASQVLDRRAARREVRTLGAGDQRYRSLPESLQLQELRQIALDWTENLRGWEQVEAIEQHLKSEYLLDPDSRPTDDCDFPAAEFLLVSKRGPDYQFATSAALLLRTLGYSTRIVSGFYASPEKFDSRSRQTPVHASDIHFWAEIYLGVGTWATVEATPGYSVLMPPPTFAERMWSCCIALSNVMIAHSVAIGAFILIAVSIFLARFAILDAALTLRWRFRTGRSLREKIIDAFQIIEFRLSSRGISRPSGSTPGDYFRHLQLRNVEQHEALIRLAEWSNWAAFCPGEHSAPNREFIEQGCRQLLRGLNRRVILKELGSDQRRRGVWTLFGRMRRERRYGRCFETI